LNLSGKWRANDGGTYYIRNIGNTLCWFGISNKDDTHKHWWAYAVSIISLQLFLESITHCYRFCILNQFGIRLKDREDKH
jgi:hypothetical protein